MSDESVNTLELRALQQRGQLHEMGSELANELKSKIAATREKLDVHRNIREHYGAAAGIAASAALIAGYTLAGAILSR